MWVQKTRVGFKLPKDINLIQGSMWLCRQASKSRRAGRLDRISRSGPRKGNPESKQSKRALANTGFECDAWKISRLLTVLVEVLPLRVFLISKGLIYRENFFGISFKSRLFFFDLITTSCPLFSGGWKMFYCCWQCGAERLWFSRTLSSRGWCCAAEGLLKRTLNSIRDTDCWRPNGRASLTSTWYPSSV